MSLISPNKSRFKNKIRLLPLLILLAAVSGIGAASPARAQVASQTIVGHFTVEPGQTRDINLGGSYNIRKLIIQAEARGRDTQVEVMVNGDVKGTIYAPGRDPSYVVTVEQRTQQISFRNIGSSTFVVHEVKGIFSSKGSYSQSNSGGNSETFQGDGEYDNTGSTGLKVVNDATDIADRAIELTRQLKPVVSDAQFIKYLSPIRLAAAELYGKGRANRKLSSARVIQKLEILKARVQAARCFLETVLEQDANYHFAVAFITLEEQIAEILE